MIIKLGVAGSEVSLVQESLILSSVTLNESSSVSLSANSTRHKDYKPVKRVFSLNYAIISKANYEALNDIYETQVSNLKNLNYIITESDGLKTYQVQMEPVSRGGDLRDRPFYSEITVELYEV